MAASSYGVPVAVVLRPLHGIDAQKMPTLCVGPYIEGRSENGTFPLFNTRAGAKTPSKSYPFSDSESKKTCSTFKREGNQFESMLRVRKFDVVSCRKEGNCNRT